MFRKRSPQFASIADLQAHIDERFHCLDAPLDYRPKTGWHTIRVGNGSHSGEATPDSLRTWGALFDQYADGRSGDLLYWKDVLHLDREMREIVARFAIVTK